MKKVQFTHGGVITVVKANGEKISFFAAGNTPVKILKAFFRGRVKKNDIPNSISLMCNYEDDMRAGKVSPHVADLKMLAACGFASARNDTPFWYAEAVEDEDRNHTMQVTDLSHAEWLEMIEALCGKVPNSSVVHGAARSV